MGNETCSLGDSLLGGLGALSEAVLLPSKHSSQVLHAAGSNLVSSLGLAGPVVCEKESVKSSETNNGRTLTSSHLARVVSSETRAGTSLLLLVPVLLASYSGEGMGLVTSLTLGLGSFGLSGKSQE